MLIHTALASHLRECPHQCRYSQLVCGGVQTTCLDDAIHQATGGHRVCTVPPQSCLGW
jgi:hypothetical protein